MIFIFIGFDREAIIEKLLSYSFISKLSNFVSTNRRKIKYIGLGVVGSLCVVLSLAAAGVTVGVNVNYSGKDIAVVENQSVFKSAVDIASKNIEDKTAKKAIKSPKFSLTLTVSDRLEDATELADSIIKNTGDIDTAVAIKVNSETVAIVRETEIKEYLEARRTAFDIAGAENTSSFVDTVVTEDGYFLKSEITTLSSAKAIIDALNVKTVSVTTTDVTIPYKTVKKTTNKETIGYSEVITAGSNGTARRVESVESINGIVATRTELSNEVVANAVDQVVLVGTAVKTVSATEKAKASSAGFIFPLSAGTYKISAYYGDGRNHKAMDFSADKGTPIFAVAGGTVTYAGYDSDFGYNVVIQHSNGISTRYAHANALCVSKGQVVSQGDMIATVGRTGWSTGNHLHFEVIVNGVRVNPAPYIGL